MLIYLSALADGAEQARFAALYEGHRRQLLYVAKGFLRDGGLAEEAVQDTFLAVAKNFSKISALDGHEVAPYLVTIVKNKCRDILRRERKYTGLAELTQTTAGDLTAEYADLREECRVLVEALKGMPDIYREVLERRLVLEQSNQEAARSLGIDENTAAKRYSRGRAMLAARLAKEGIGNG